MTLPADLSATPRSVLELGDLDADELSALLDLGATMKRHPHAWRHRLEGRLVACSFRPGALNAHATFATAIYRLGALPVLCEPGAAPDDDVLVLSCSCSAVVVEGMSARRLRALASGAGLPVVNAGDRGQDPCGALALCLALRERFGTLDGRTVAYLGPADGLVHSLLQAAPLAGFDVRLACPPDGLPDPWIIASAGRALRLFDDPSAAAAAAHAVVSPTLIAPAHRVPMAQALLHALITGDWEDSPC